MARMRMNQEKLLTILEKLPWGTIDAIVQEADQEALWPDGFVEAALLTAKKALLRHEIKMLVDPAGFPLVASVLSPTATGEDERQYKLELYFSEDDYRQMVAYYVDRALYMARMAYKYRERAQKRYKIEIPLQLPLFGDN